MKKLHEVISRRALRRLIDEVEIDARYWWTIKNAIADGCVYAGDTRLYEIEGKLQTRIAKNTNILCDKQGWTLHIIAGASRHEFLWRATRAPDVSFEAHSLLEALQGIHQKDSATGVPPYPDLGLGE